MAGEDGKKAKLPSRFYCRIPTRRTGFRLRGFGAKIALRVLGRSGVCRDAAGAKRLFSSLFPLPLRLQCRRRRLPKTCSTAAMSNPFSRPPPPSTAELRALPQKDLEDRESEALLSSYIGTAVGVGAAVIAARYGRLPPNKRFVPLVVLGLGGAIVDFSLGRSAAAPFKEELDRRKKAEAGL